MSFETITRKAIRIHYIAGESVLHHLHPLTKMLWLVIGTLSIFIIHHPLPIVAGVFLLIMAFGLIGVNVSKIKGSRLFFSTALFLGLLQVLFVQEGSLLLALGRFQVTREGIHSGLYIAGRFLIVLMLSYLFVLTTEPNDLAYALMQSGLPYRYGFTFVTALRLVPIFAEEGRNVYNAQLVRGVQYDVKHIGRFFRLIRQYLLPLLISALRKVDALAVSMEGRCFGKYPGRTYVREVRFSWRDAVAVVGIVIFLVMVVVWQFYGGGR